VRVLMKADPSCRESLQAEAEVDPMDGEQTWPTESELLEAEGAATESTYIGILQGSVVSSLHSFMPHVHFLTLYLSV